MNKKLLFLLKVIYNRRLIHRFINLKLVGWIHKFIYLVKFSKWRADHPCPEFNSEKYDSRYNLYTYINETEIKDDETNYFEFGVSSGKSLIWWIKNITNPNSSFAGFDTFEGLPSQWDHVPKGAFGTNNKIPDIDDPRCNFHVGLFQDTLPGFIENIDLSNKKTIIHLDADLYSSTLFVLMCLKPSIKSNDIIIFDELGSLGHPTSEFRAFLDFLSVYPSINYKVIATSFYSMQVAIKIL